MDFREVTAYVNRIERRWQLFEHPLDDRNLWEYIRKHIWLAAREEHTDSDLIEVSPAADGATTGTQLRSLARSLIDPRRNPFSESADILCFGFGRRRRREDGHWWDVVYDPILPEFPDSWTLVEPPISSAPHLHYADSKTDVEKHRYGDVFAYVPRIWERLPGKYPTLSEDAEARLDGVETDVRQLIGVDVPLREHARAVRQRYDLEKRLYRALLRRHNPDVVVVAGAHRMAIETARQAGIPTVELQHGTINKYQSRFAYPAGPRPVTVADHIFTWGPGWIDESDLPQRTSLHPVGYAYSDEEVASAARQSKQGLENQIVVVSQFFTGKRLANVALELGDRLPETRVVFKPHPAVEQRWQEVYPELTVESVTVVTSQDRSLYDVFADSTAQLGVSSTALFEGLRFDLETFVLDEFTADYCEQLFEAGAATRVSGATDLIEAYTGEAVAHDTTAFFEPFDEGAVRAVLQTVQ